MSRATENLKLLAKLAVITVGMFSFGYAMVPIYKKFCEVTGFNILSVQQSWIPGTGDARGKASDRARNTQVDYERTIKVEFDTNTTGPWEFKPSLGYMEVHPGELATVMYEFRNVQNRRMTAQAVPSYAPRQAGPHFHKLECFCFSQYTLDAGETKEWPVTFVIDPKLTKDVRTITLSYTFFEVGGATPAAPGSSDLDRAGIVGS